MRRHEQIWQKQLKETKRPASVTYHVTNAKMIRGGGSPCQPMASMPTKRMGPPPRSLATDAHNCIMVWIPRGIHRIQGCGDDDRYDLAGSPQIVFGSLSSVESDRPCTSTKPEPLERGAFGEFRASYVCNMQWPGHHCSSARAFAVNPSRLPARPFGLPGVDRESAAKQRSLPCPSMQNCACTSAEQVETGACGELCA